MLLLPLKFSWMTRRRTTVDFAADGHTRGFQDGILNSDHTADKVRYISRKRWLMCEWERPAPDRSPGGQASGSALAPQGSMGPMEMLADAAQNQALLLEGCAVHAHARDPTVSQPPEAAETPASGLAVVPHVTPPVVPQVTKPFVIDPPTRLKYRFINPEIPMRDSTALWGEMEMEFAEETADMPWSTLLREMNLRLKPKKKPSGQMTQDETIDEENAIYFSGDIRCQVVLPCIPVEWKVITNFPIQMEDLFLELGLRSLALRCPNWLSDRIHVVGVEVSGLFPFFIRDNPDSWEWVGDFGMRFLEGVSGKEDTLVVPYVDKLHWSLLVLDSKGMYLLGTRN